MKQSDCMSSRQIKAARALLEWSQENLAASAGISVVTVRRIEAGHIPTRSTNAKKIYNCMNAAGIEFLEFDGVRRRPTGIYIYEGTLGGEEFCEDLKKTIQKAGGDILIVTPNLTDFARYCGFSDISKLNTLLDASATATLKCLGGDDLSGTNSTSRFQFRSLALPDNGIIPFCAYGNKFGLLISNGQQVSSLVVVEDGYISKSAYALFFSLWGSAAPANKSEAMFESERNNIT
jgi:transcriptional regulator with XRE-family HTH domain